MSKASKNEDEWCIVFDLQHYSKDQAFELGSAITQGKLRILHDKRIAIVADSRKAAEEYVRQINENLMEGISSPFHFFYTLMENAELEEEEEFYKMQNWARGQARMQREKDDMERYKQWKAERGIMSK